MFKYSTYQKLFLRTGLLMIAILYSEFSFSQNCNGRIPCHAVPSGASNVVSPTVRRIGIPTSSEEPAAVPVSNRGGR